MPISQAWRAAPHATFVRPDFRKYVAESRKVMEILARYADVLEVVGMDEAYLDITQKSRATGGEPDGVPDGMPDGMPDGVPGAPDWDVAKSIAHSLQAAVKRELHLSCSVGIGPSKSVAKIASDARKPHGVFRLRPSEVVPYLDPLPAGKLHGCGPKTAAALREAGIQTIGDLARSRPRDLEARFGSHGAWLHRIANGDDPRVVDAERGERKSRGNETTFLRDEADPQAVARVAAGLLDELLDDARRGDGRGFSTLTVKVRYSDFTTLTRARTSERPLVASEAFGEAAAHDTVANLLTPLLDGRPVRLVGVRLSGFEDLRGQRRLSAYGVGCSLARAASRLSPGLPAEPFRSRLPAGSFDPRGLRWTSLAAFPHA